MFGQPFGIAHINELSDGAGIIDTRFTYSPEEAYEILEAQGENGRKAYSYLVIADFICPIIYSLFCAITITFLFQRLFASDHPLQKLSLLPFIACFGDIAENLCITTILINYPNRLLAVATISNYFTLTKYIFLIVSIILIVGLIWLLINKFFKKKSLRAKRIEK